MNQNKTIFVGDYSDFMEDYISDEDLEHFRVGGEKKGVRRYQYPDGSLTPEGRRHYDVGPPREKNAEKPEKPKKATLSSEQTESPSRIKKMVDGFKQRREERKAAQLKAYESAKAEAAKKARIAKMREGKVKAKAAREQHAKDVEAMTRTPEDLIKNRDKLSDEEFKAAADKFRDMKKRQDENDKFLRQVNGLRIDDDKPTETASKDENKGSTSEPDPLMPKPYEDSATGSKVLREQVLQDAVKNYNAKELIANRGRFTDEEFNRLKVAIASKSTANIKKLESYMDDDEYDRAITAYGNREGKRKAQVKQDLANTAGMFKSVSEAVTSSYNVIDTATKLSTGRSVSDLAKATIGRNIMTVMEENALYNLQSKAKASQAAQKVADSLVDEFANVRKRAASLNDKDYLGTIAQYYDALLRMQGNSGGNNGGNKPGGNKPGGKPGGKPKGGGGKP